MRLLPFPPGSAETQFHPALWFHLCHQPLPFSRLFALLPELTAPPLTHRCACPPVCARVCERDGWRWGRFKMTKKTSLTLFVVMSEHSRLTVMTWNNVMPPSRPACSAFMGSLRCDWCVPSPPLYHRFLLLHFSARNCYALTTRDLRGALKRPGFSFLLFFLWFLSDRRRNVLRLTFFDFFLPCDSCTSEAMNSITAAQEKPARNPSKSNVSSIKWWRREGERKGGGGGWIWRRYHRNIIRATTPPHKPESLHAAHAKTQTR